MMSCCVPCVSCGVVWCSMPAKTRVLKNSNKRKIKKLAMASQATFKPKKKGQEMSAFELKMHQMKMKLEEDMRQATLDEYEALVSGGRQAEADAFRQINLKYFPIRDTAKAFRSWKMSVLLRTQIDAKVASLQKKIDKYQKEAGTRDDEIARDKVILEADAYALSVCIAKEQGPRMPDVAAWTLTEVEDRLKQSAIERIKYHQLQKKKVEQMSKQLDISAIGNETVAETSDEEKHDTPMFADLSLSSPRSASSH